MFYEDMEQLGIASPTIEPKATEHVQEIIDMIQGLIDKEMAYEVDGDVYYAVDTFKAGYRLEELKRNAECLMADIDFLVVPTAPTIPTISAVNSDPVVINSRNENQGRIVLPLFV